MSAGPATGALDGKVALVTGASRGLGLAVAAGFARAGARVALAGRDAAALDHAARHVHAAAPGAELSTHAVDLARDGAAEALVVAVLARFGVLDVLVNNAAIGGPLHAALWDAAPAEIEAVLRTNVWAPLACAAAAVRAAARARRVLRVLNVSSGIAGHAHAGLGAYAISKTALEAASAALAADAQQAGLPVTVVTLRPPSLRSAMTEAYFGADAAARLPAPESVVDGFLRVATAPHAEVHGRTIAL